MIFPSILYKYLLPQESTGIRNKRVKIFVIIFSICVCLFRVYLLRQLLIENFFPKFIEAVNAIRIMSLSVIPSSIALILEAQFLGKERSKIVIIGTGISLVFLTIGMIVLGSWIGIIGVAWSLVIATTAKTFFLSNKKLQIYLIFITIHALTR